MSEHGLDERFARTEIVAQCGDTYPRSECEFTKARRFPGLQGESLPRLADEGGAAFRELGVSGSGGSGHGKVRGCEEGRGCD